MPGLGREGTVAKEFPPPPSPTNHLKQPVSQAGTQGCGPGRSHQGLIRAVSGLLVPDQQEEVAKQWFPDWRVVAIDCAALKALPSLNVTSPKQRWNVALFPLRCRQWFYGEASTATCGNAAAHTCACAHACTLTHEHAHIFILSSSVFLDVDARNMRPQSALTKERKSSEKTYQPHISSLKDSPTFLHLTSQICFQMIFYFLWY